MKDEFSSLSYLQKRKKLDLEKSQLAKLNLAQSIVLNAFYVQHQ